MSERPDFDDELLLERAAVLKHLFSGDVSVQSAAEQLATISLYPEENLGLTWTAVLVAARTFPEHQEELVELLIRISRLPPAEDKDGKQMTNYDGRIWQDLPLLGIEFNYEWNGLSVPDDSGPARQKVLKEFINVNAFTARLKLTGLPPFEEYDMFGLWTMRAATEDEPASEIDPRDIFIPAAEAWISIAGPQIYEWDRELEYGGIHGDPGGGGSLWGGKHGFCKERWCLWRRRFAEFAESEVLSDEVRKTAASAGMRMEEIEAGGGN